MIDAVSVCTSNSTHAAISVAACKAKKHVLCEKPMAVSSHEAKQMIAAANDNDVILMIAQNQRFDSAHMAAKKLLESGKLGRVLSFQSSFSYVGPENWLKGADKNNIWFFQAAQTGFGVLGDLGVHKIDLLCWLLNDTVVQSNALVDTLDKRFPDNTRIRVEDNAVLSMRFCKGTLGSMLFSWTAYGEENNTTILYCENGMIVLHRDTTALRVVLKDGTVLYNVPESEMHQEHSGIIDAFVDSINTGVCVVPGQEGLRALQILECALQNG